MTWLTAYTTQSYFPYMTLTGASCSNHLLAAGSWDASNAEQVHVACQAMMTSTWQHHLSSTHTTPGTQHDNTSSQGDLPVRVDDQLC